MYRLVFVCVIVTNTLLTGVHAAEMYLCGATLANSLAFVCRGRGYYWTQSKRSGAYVTKRGAPENVRIRRNVHSPFLSDTEATDFLTSRDGGKTRIRRGIVDECCLSPCNFRHLESYCAAKTTIRSPATTTPRPRRTLTTAPPTTLSPPPTAPFNVYSGNDVNNESGGQLYNNHVIVKGMNEHGGSLADERSKVNATLVNSTAPVEPSTAPGNKLPPLKPVKVGQPTSISRVKFPSKMKLSKYIQKKLNKINRMRGKQKTRFQLSSKLGRYTTALPRLAKAIQTPFLHSLLKRYNQNLDWY